MAKLTVARARKILGKLSESISDEEIEKDINVAEMLKNLFFNQYLKQKTIQNDYNKNNNAKA